MTPPLDPADEIARLRRWLRAWTWVAIAGGVLTLWGWFGRPVSRAQVSTTSTPSTKSISWHQTGEWHGSTSRTTEDFSVSSSYWKVIWSTRPGDMGAMNFAVTLHDAAGRLAPSGVANTIGAGDDSSFFRSPGRFYFDIMALQPYSIRIVESR